MLKQRKEIKEKKRKKENHRAFFCPLEKFRLSDERTAFHREVLSDLFSRRSYPTSGDPIAFLLPSIGTRDILLVGTWVLVMVAP